MLYFRHHETGPERLTDLSKVTQQINRRVRLGLGFLTPSPVPSLVREKENGHNHCSGRFLAGHRHKHGEVRVITFWL